MYHCMIYPNRAKCKLCNSVIESFHQADYVTCKCGEYAVLNGAGLDCESKSGDWSNFVRVDDLGNEITVKHIQKSQSKEDDQSVDEANHNLSVKEAISALDEIIKTYNNFPSHEKTSYVLQYELVSFMEIVSGLFKRIV